MESKEKKDRAAGNSLAELARRWKRFERNTKEQRQEAERYYEDVLMKPIIKAYIENNREYVEKANFLILSVGTSCEPLILNIKLLNPHKILFLYTEKSERSLDKVIQYCKLSEDRYEKSKVHEAKPQEIYREIKHAYLKWKRPKKIFVDFTGGTKAMAAATAMAGTMIGVQLLYVGNRNYLEDFRKPDPGSEKLFCIDNPLVIFGDIEIEKALALFKEYNYAGARERLEALQKEEIPNPDICRELNLACLLAKGYEAWDMLEFSAAYEHIKELNRQIKNESRRHGQFLLVDFAKRLKQQEEVLAKLNEIPKLLKEKKQMEILQDSNYIIPLMFTLYTNAYAREQQEKYDMATLLLYRLLEMIEQRRLSRYGLYASQMEYKNIVCNFKQRPDLKSQTEEERLTQLREEMLRLRKELFGECANIRTSRKPGKIPVMSKKVSVMEGFILLKVLQDPITLPKKGEPDDKLQRIRSGIELRNNSIFAHGLGPVGKEDFQEFKKLVEEMFRELCHIERVSFKGQKDIVTWVNPMDSQYYIMKA